MPGGGSGSAKIVKEFPIDLVKNIGTYDVCTAAGDVLILGQTLYVVLAAGGLVSAEVLSNQATPVPLLTAAEGVLANLTIDKVLGVPTELGMASRHAWTLRAGQKIQYKINGANGTAGSMKLIVEYAPLTGGAGLA
jgi:hypothetical protein